MADKTVDFDPTIGITITLEPSDDPDVARDRLRIRVNGTEYEHQVPGGGGLRAAKAAGRAGRKNGATATSRRRSMKSRGR